MSEKAKRGTGKSLLTLPIALWALLMFSGSLRSPRVATMLAALVTLVFMVALFFLMMKTAQTHRWRRVFFVALGFLFPVGFIWNLIAARGSMSISVEQMLSGNTPFCFMAIPMMLIPAALWRTVVFPGSILPTASNGASIATMIGLWFAATIFLGKGWCSFGCFFGGIEEGFSAVAKKTRIKNINPRWRLVPWAVLIAIVLLSAATLEPTYCMWLCPFKTVTEYPAVRSVTTAVQAGIFLSLFLVLVVGLPLLTKKRTQCAFFCPFGAFQSLFNKVNPFEIRVDQAKCVDCVSCRNGCPTQALDAQSVAAGKTLLTCMKCGACVDVCKKGAAVWHIKGTPVGISSERARLLYLYAAWGFAVMFGGSIISNSLAKIFGMFG